MEDNKAPNIRDTYCTKFSRMYVFCEPTDKALAVRYKEGNSSRLIVILFVTFKDHYKPCLDNDNHHL